MVQLDPTHARVKLLHACDLCMSRGHRVYHFSRTVLALFSHCSHTVLTLFSHCSRPVISLSSHCMHCKSCPPLKAIDRTQCRSRRSRWWRSKIGRIQARLIDVSGSSKQCLARAYACSPLLLMSAVSTPLLLLTSAASPPSLPLC